MSSVRQQRVGRRRRTAALVTVLAVVVASLASMPDASAANPAPASATGPAAVAGQAVEITLITGDKVRYEAGPDGKQQVTVVEAVSTAFRGEEPPEGGVYLFPEVAEAYVASGVLDRELFNIEYLAANGYDDAHMQGLPLIVDYAGDGPAVASRARGDAAGLAASRTGPVLESIGAAGVSVDKAQADRFWESLAPQASAAETPAVSATGARSLLAAGELSPAVDKIWLDRKVSVTLNESVPLIGAPEAWEAGYDGAGVTVAVLDTGVDATHPDLTGTVVASKSFVSDSVNDGHGHGTHVASTIVGTGAASDGQHQGVAPGADLVVGKVLNDAGSGTFAQIIDGMEWAAQEQDADVISISLGCGPRNGCVSDGTDPASMAVNSLTASTGALFVIAAGNDGLDPETLGTPGVADAALTVAASNEGDIVNPIPRFSSRGPRIDGVLKPDIAAPGVHITAARAAGTSLCETGCLQPEDGPVDDFYTNASGTSMATPHVAGAAAILAQQHPDWTAEQLKTTLMSTSLGLKELFGTKPASAYAQGAGRVDIARAVSQQLRTDTANISPGILELDEPAHDVPVTYTNDSTNDLTVSVDAALRLDGDQPAAAGTISLDQDTLTIPAGASATLTVTIDPSAATEFGVYDGVLTASTEAGDTLRTPIGVTIQPPLNDLTIRLIKPAPVSQLSFFDVGGGWGALRVDDQEVPWLSPSITWRATDDPQVIEATMPVPDGIYMVFGRPSWVVNHQKRNNATIIEPDVTVDGDTAITIDMRDLVPVTASADQPTEEVWRVHTHRVTSEAGESLSSMGIVGVPLERQRWAYPNEPATLGELSVREGFILAEPELLLGLRAGGRRITLQPAYPDPPANAEDRLPKFTRDTKTVLATEADLEAGLDVQGALVLVNLPKTADYVEPCPTGPWRTWHCAAVNRLQQAAEAGAAGVLFTTPRVYLAGLRSLSNDPYVSMVPPVPFAWLDEVQAARLTDLLGSEKPVEVQVTAAVDPAYEYKAWFRESGQVPADMAYELDSRDLKRVEAAYHGPESTLDGTDNAYEYMHAFWPGELLSFATVRHFDAPTRRVEYYLPTGPEVVQDLGLDRVDHSSGTTKKGDTWRTIVGTEPETIDWGTVATPGQARLDDITTSDVPWGPCAVCRQGDHLWVIPQPTMGHGSHYYSRPSYHTSMRLFDADGSEISAANGPGGFELPPEAGRYRLEHVQTDPATDTRYGRQVRTVWDFTATARPTVNEVEFPYAKPRFFDPDPAAWQPVIFLNYEIPLALDTTTSAGRPIWITVHAAAGEPGSGADIAGLELQASFDDGENWAEPLVIRPIGDGTFQVLIRQPALSQTTGAVTLRTHAWDGAGNEVTQTIDRAYGLR